MTTSLRLRMFSRCGMRPHTAYRRQHRPRPGRTGPTTRVRQSSGATAAALPALRREAGRTGPTTQRRQSRQQPSSNQPQAAESAREQRSRGDRCRAGWAEPTTQQQRRSSGQAYPLLPLRLRAGRTELATQVLQSSGETKAAAALPALRRRAGWTEPTTQQQRGICQQAGDGAAAPSGRCSTGPATARRPASGGVGPSQPHEWCRATVRRQRWRTAASITEGGRKASRAAVMAERQQSSCTSSSTAAGGVDRARGEQRPWQQR